MAFGVPAGDAAVLTAVLLLAPLVSLMVGGAIGSVLVIARALAHSRIIFVGEALERRWKDRKA